MNNVVKGREVVRIDEKDLNRHLTTFTDLFIVIFLTPLFFQALKKKGFVRGYLKTMGKVVGLVASVVGLILLLHIGYTMSGWLWEQMTLKVMIFIYVTIMILFLALFRP